MQPRCTVDDQCLYFFPSMGFRPAVHVVQRDQYGDRMALVVGDDSPMQGKVPPGYANYNLLVDPYATLGDAVGPAVAALSQGASGGAPAMARTASFWGGGGFSGGGFSGGGFSAGGWSGGGGSSGGSTGGGNTSGPETGYTPKPVEPTKPTDPVIEVPVDPEIPPLTPVPLPDAAPLLIASLLAFALLRRLRG
ncbi:hypothetical protein [Paracoccus sp. S3-43]|uniref:hypothetical protein n=1 Tax=Paracoccus sp. S3-43 TaxID=3030011 RepID=UPI0023AF0D54|nr:hypothetical protein [Paracoccus sp. S3-43]WEF25285.1 hypothetical protein PXD02_04920 [Paracoccus sp. S3-43]